MTRFFFGVEMIFFWRAEHKSFFLACIGFFLASKGVSAVAAAAAAPIPPVSLPRFFFGVEVFLWCPCGLLLPGFFLAWRGFFLACMSTPKKNLPGPVQGKKKPCLEVFFWRGEVFFWRGAGNGFFLAW